MPQLGGYDFPIDPDLDAKLATVLWTPAAAPAIAQVLAEPPFAAVTLGALRRSDLDLDAAAERQAWNVLRDGTVVVSTIPGSQDRPVGILIPLDAHWRVRLAAADRFRDALIGRRPPALLTHERRRRIKRALQTVDARRRNASYRDIAEAYFGSRRTASEPWKTSALKAQVSRLAAYGNVLVGDGYRQLLCGKSAARTRRR
ncbi:MAG: DUF2285 domain-containing protein [Pseudomonadota bacterium]